MSERPRAEWHAEFRRLVGERRAMRPVLVFLPSWWPGRHIAFAYFNVVAIGPGLLSAPAQVRNYVLAHELGHIDRGHTAGQVVYWLGVLAALLLGQRLPPGLAMTPIAIVLIAAVAWIFLGEARREFEADDAAAERYGDQGSPQGLRPRAR
jgi:Zn-dependent protease with chaperone function